MNATDPYAYQYQPGAIALRVRNIATMAGERLLGFVPYGLTALRARNEGGKSRVLCALAQIPLDKLDAEAFQVTDGASGGAVALGVAELAVSTVTTAGRARPKVDRTQPLAEGPILPLASPIETLVNGGHHKGKDAAWRERIKALVRFVRAQVTEEALRHLAGPPLAAPHDDVAAWVLGKHAVAPFPTLIEAAESLAGPKGLFNSRGLEAEKAVIEQGHVVSRCEGSRGAVVAELAGVAGVDLADEAAEITLEQLLAEHAPDVEAGRVNLAAAREWLGVTEREVIAARSEAAARQNEQERRQRLAASHGERPSEDDATAAADAAVDAHSHAREVFAEAQANTTTAALVRLLNGTAEHEAKLEADNEVEDLRAQLRAAEDRQRAADRAYELLRQQRTGEALAALQAARVDVETREREATAARARALEVTRLASAWDAVEAQLAEPLPAAARDVEACEQAHSDARRRVLLASKAVVVREASDKLEAAKLEHQQLEDWAQVLRDQVNRVWDRLGELMNRELPPDLLRVGEGGRIEVRRDDGTWCDVADDVRLSTGRLHRGVLDFAVERSPEGANIVVPDWMVFPIDPRGRVELSERAAARRLRMIYEEPFDVETPTLFWWGEASGSVNLLNQGGEG